MTLKDARKGEKYIIEKSLLKQPAKQRLEAMGLIEGTKVRKINQALDGSVIFMVRGTRLAVGKELAEFIIVHEDNSINTNHSKKRGKEDGIKQ
ncbi:MAG: FeoA family protein [Acetivibrionales bacterium]|jgi:ferrous iron transport protein A|nr:ferrous iron transport protein A [Clostridiaceae bacterium]